MSQPAPTSCIQVPTLETTVAIHSARNTGMLSGDRVGAEPKDEMRSCPALTFFGDDSGQHRPAN
jgi:hypothetical protein